MSFRIRAARPGDDFARFYDMAKLTGGGFTNLPADRGDAGGKLDRSRAGFERDGETPGDDLYVFVLENAKTEQIRGTCQVFGAGRRRPPFYSYPSQHADPEERGAGHDLPQPDAEPDHRPRRLERSRRPVPPSRRARRRLGMLLARSRYLFIKLHRARFGDAHRWPSCAA